MKVKILTVAGVMLCVPLVLVIGFDLWTLRKVRFVADYNQDQMGSVELAIGVIMLLLTAPFALGGVALILWSRRAADSVGDDNTWKIVAASAAVLLLLVLVWFFF